MPSSELSPDKSRAKDSVLTENTDDFIIGDRVWVNGTKPGYIQYLGETRFGPGEWAGVVLDDYSGKNDGTVSGFRYFQCEPKKGVFARLHKLTRFPITTEGSSPTPGGRASSPFGGSGCGSNGGRSGSNSPLPPRAVSPGSLLAGRMGPPKVGDRVVVNASGGPKAGTLRFLGNTEFAAGEWAGVELDAPTGKNDGTVAGKKYFECGTNYGLFAPAHKVSRATGSVASRRYQHLHGGSQESLNSSLSSGTFTGGRVKSDRRKGGGAGECEEEVERKKTTREDTNSVDQLLKERGLEREVVVKAAAQLDQVESELSQLQGEHRRYVEESERRANRLRQLLDAAEAERRTLAAKLQDEKRRVEDLQFRVDEECISKDDLETQTKKERLKLQELEAELEEERLKSKALSEGKSLDAAMEEIMKKQSKEARLLREQLKEAQMKIHDLEMQQRQRQRSPPPSLRMMGSSRNLEDEITKKEEQLLQLQVTLDNKKRELESINGRVAEMEKELQKYKTRQDKYLETIDSLNIKMQKLESQCVSANEAQHQAKQDVIEMEARLSASEERYRELERERDTLRERSDDQLSSDQLSATLTQDIRQKDKKLAELERRLEDAAIRRREEETRLKEEHRNAIQTMQSEHKEELKIWSMKCERLEQQLELVKEEQKQTHRKDEISRQEIEERFRREMDRKDAQLKRLEARLQEAQLSLEDVTRLKEQLDRAHADRDRLRSEKEETRRRLDATEDRRKRSEEEREAHVAMLKAEVLRLRTEFTTYREDLVKRLAETQYDTRIHEELQEQIEMQRRLLEDVQRRLRETQGEKVELQTELTTSRVSQAQQQQELETQNGTLQQEVEVLKKRIGEAVEEIESLKRNLEAAQIIEEQRQEQIDSNHNELNRLRSELQEKSCEEKVSEREKTHLENKLAELQVELEKTQTKAAVPDSEHQQVKTERDALENQVEFLNKVIVDMQQKNDDLRGRLEILETEVIFDGNLQLGNNNHDHPPALFRRSSSHLYCDLCDSYGLHDTDQCPKKETSSALLSPSISLSLCEESEMF